MDCAEKAQLKTVNGYAAYGKIFIKFVSENDFVR